ncbi:hypothetical protein VTI74DRAFT_8021 [Chaetomium olivicolor]
MARGLRQLALLGLAGLPGSLAAAGPADVSCVGLTGEQGTYTNASGAVYQVVCGRDYSGSDVAPAVQTSTFAGCIDACDSAPGCADVSYVGESCYLKKKSDDFVQRDWKLTCVDKKSDKTTYTTSAGAVFGVECGIDYAGGDISGSHHSSRPHQTQPP